MERFSDTRSAAFSAEGAGFLRQTVNNDPVHYLLEMMIQGGELAQRAGHVARIFDPADQRKVFRPVESEALAFFRGELLALMLAQEYLSEDAFPQLLAAMWKGVVLPDQSPLPAPEKEAVGREKIINIGQRGWDLAEPFYGNLFDYWKSGLINRDPDMDLLHYGFGYVLFFMNEVYYEEYEKAFQGVDAEDQSFDVGLARLLQEDD